jgi:NhaP-type Na+/H+ or K+/H+ antiporter
MWVAAVPLAGVDLNVEMDGGTEAVTLREVVVVALGAGLLGWALLALLEWRLRRAVAIWTTVALVVTLLSLLGPLILAANTAAAGVLVCMHLVVAGVLIPVLRRTSSALRTR